MKLFSRYLVVLMSLFAVVSVNGGKVGVADVEPKLIVAKIHADWCGTCRALAPEYETAREALKSEPVLFVTLDYTDEATSAQANFLAYYIDITELVKDNNGTGRILLIDPESGELKQQLNGKKSSEKIVAAIREALASSVE